MPLFLNQYYLINSILYVIYMCYSNQTTQRFMNIHIYDRYSECKNRFTVYYNRFLTFFCLNIIRCLGKELAIDCRMLNDLIDCDDVATATSHCNKHFYFTTWHSGFSFTWTSQYFNGGDDHMVVGFITTCAISAYHH
jgi:hypothetical protein